jgi:hypothetical protein
MWQLYSWAPMRQAHLPNCCWLQVQDLVPDMRGECWSHTWVTSVFIVTFNALGWWKLLSTLLCSWLPQKYVLICIRSTKPGICWHYFSLLFREQSLLMAWVMPIPRILFIFYIAPPPSQFESTSYIYISPTIYTLQDFFSIFHTFMSWYHCPFISTLLCPDVSYPPLT